MLLLFVVGDVDVGVDVVLDVDDDDDNDGDDGNDDDVSGVTSETPTLGKHHRMLSFAFFDVFVYVQTRGPKKVQRGSHTL